MFVYARNREVKCGDPESEQITSTDLEILPLGYSTAIRSLQCGILNRLENLIATGMQIYITSLAHTFITFRLMKGFYILYTVPIRKWHCKFSPNFSVSQ